MWFAIVFIDTVRNNKLQQILRMAQHPKLVTSIHTLWYETAKSAPGFTNHKMHVVTYCDYSEQKETNSRLSLDINLVLRIIVYRTLLKRCKTNMGNGYMQGDCWNIQKGKELTNWKNNALRQYKIWMLQKKSRSLAVERTIQEKYILITVNIGVSVFILYLDVAVTSSYLRIHVYYCHRQ